MKEGIVFPPGFIPATRRLKSLAKAPVPVVTLSPSGFLILNTKATELLCGKDGSNTAVVLAYNPKTSVLALKGVERKFSTDAYAINTTGHHRQYATVRIGKSLQNIWRLPMDKRRCKTEWDSENKILYVHVREPIAV